MAPLYKFIKNLLVAHSFLGGAIKFTPVAELNDPSELNPNLNTAAIRDSLQQLRTRGYSEHEYAYLCRQATLLDHLVPEFQATRAPETREEATRQIQSRIYDSSTYMERKMSETAKAIASKVGIFCLSKRFDPLPMWASLRSWNWILFSWVTKQVYCGSLVKYLMDPRLRA